MNSIVCIYCKESRPRPRRGEHVILEALGGTTTIADVCGGREGCNQKFGDTIDRELLRNSLVTLQRLVIPSGAGHEQQMFLLRPDHNAWLDVVVRVAERCTVVLPQLYFHGGRLVSVCSPEFEGERHRLASANFEDLERAVRFIQDAPQSTPRIVFHVSRRRYILRARSEREAEEFLELLERKLPALSIASAEGSSDETLPADTKMVLPLSTSMNDGPRCAAKMAFNFLCLYLGPQVALRPSFDSVRDYISGRNVEPVREVVVGDEIGLTIDTRHVANWATSDRSASQWNLFREAHYILLHLYNSEICAEVGLFGGRSPFLLRLGRAPEDVVLRSLPAAFLTPLAGGGDRVLACFELYGALRESGVFKSPALADPSG